MRHLDVKSTLQDVRTFLLCPKRLALTRKRCGTEPCTIEMAKIAKVTGILNSIFARSMSGKHTDWKSCTVELNKQFPDTQDNISDQTYVNTVRTLLNVFNTTIKAGYKPMMMEMPFVLQLGLGGSIDFVFRNHSQLIMLWVRRLYEPSLIKLQSITSTVYHLVAEQNFRHRGFETTVIEVVPHGLHAVIKQPPKRSRKLARDRLRQIVTLVDSHTITFPDFTHCRSCPYSSICGP